MHLKICGLDYPPYFNLRDNGTRIEGIFVDFLQILSASLNFSFSFRPVTPDDMLLPYENAPFIKFFYNINGKDCHMFWMPFTPSYELNKLVDISAEVMTSGMVIVSGGSDVEQSAATWQIFYNNRMVFCGLTVLMLFFSIVTFGLERSSEQISTKKISYFGLLWAYLSSLLLKSIKIETKTMASSIVWAMWWMCVVISAALFGGILSSNLAVGDKGTIDTLDDLLERPKVQPLIVTGTYDEVFKNARNNSLAEIYARIEKRNGKITWPMHQWQVNKLLQRKSALIIPDTGSDILVTSFCKDRMVGKFYNSESIYTMAYGFLLYKGLPQSFKKALNIKCRYFAATAQVVQAFRQQRNKLAACFYTASITHTKGDSFLLLIVVWAIGMTTAILAFFSELCIYKFQKSASQKRKNSNARRRKKNYSNIK